MPLSVLMTVLFLWQLQSQGLASRTLQYKQLCRTMWKECTSYENHGKVSLSLGQLWFLTFLIGFRVLTSQPPPSPLPPSQLCTGAPSGSPASSTAAGRGCMWERTPLCSPRCSTHERQVVGPGRCLHSNSLSGLQEKQWVTYICWIKMVYGAN